MVKNIILEGVVYYDAKYDLWCVGEDYIEEYHIRTSKIRKF